MKGQCKSVLTESDEGHDEDLGALSKEHGEQHALPGGTENVPMHLLPSRLLLCVLLGRDGESVNEATQLLHMKKVKG